MLDTINFTLTAECRQGDEQTFRDVIDWILANGVGGASFEAAEVTGGVAYLHGSIVGDRRLVAESGLAEYLSDVLARKEGIHVDISVHIASPGRQLPAEHAAVAA
ncbi:hypothetical protein [Arthrobacter crystallopoietes]|jgi:hypothetical protein|uniref:Uncharacterized protein n=1 Tax=Crystallibacter crystallopoietes TaxID=37928 RepID=A0A1H1E049_9MICC|nr:hypothetical protein [Arthrobacter crystallopoietes]AUI50095.1 hypothetical protein AC20117_03940 [Arthrobacter crystallopoietes]SDQ82124.1 hypothetical protein SAMN04489742_2700 [Arthrobacter crystallopoietes]